MIADNRLKAKLDQITKFIDISDGNEWKFILPFQSTFLSFRIGVL